MKKNDLMRNPDFIRQMEELYQNMEDAYDQTAHVLGFSCSGCSDNCCDSYFLHHTYTEWAYLWAGLKKLQNDQLQKITARAARCVIESEAAIVRGERPTIMCPLNEDGLCSLYPYRLMICRLHGVPATFTRPDGQKMNFPGCFRCQELLTPKKSCAPMDRTKFFRRMVELEIGLLGRQRLSTPKVKLTIAQMIVKGPPEL